MRIEAKTLDEAYLEAAKRLNCSVSDLNAKVIQYPSKGIFGLFAKPAIIEVDEHIDFDIEDVLPKIKEGLENLFKKSCFNVEVSEVKKYDEETVFIKLDGEDAALLIGKEGYRYNALNYMFYNWINQKYGFKVRLEIAEFLKNQEEMLRSFLAPFIEKVRQRGYGKTKPFDGILAFLALEILREAFPEKYVAIKERNGEKYVVIGDRHGDNSGNSDS
ncbi:Jag N-terminal domain-containing protein [Caminibacter pacificus]|uniref:KH domain-containing protein n=1 Tax=Caminibacter pacificus TaxID=1424653 RepID=A0AAJ4RDX0_9BACT|nr:Jag N-terminal domain-containing protein [Caminibacter pacificus]NPA87865.1 KH domain-containing protein [Campylobacterota bacterium]QCI28492.1 KH domain-containing protein [Caminibacter pacificus]ROR40781.1 spoIIIJ-associated protein [Caminibacter pacificus]